jgi:integrase
VQGAGTLAPLGELLPGLTASEYFPHYIEECDLSESTKRNYRSRWKHDIEPIIGRYRMADVTSRQFNHLIKKLVKKEKKLRKKRNRPSPGFVENRLTPAKSMFTYAHATGYISTNPGAKKKAPKYTPRKQGEFPADDPTRILDEPRVRVLVAWGQRSVAAGGIVARRAIAVMLALFLALRISESVAVLWSDIDFEERVIHISRQWSAEEKELISTKGTCKERHLPIPRTLYTLLRLLHAEEQRRRDFDRDDLVAYLRDPREPMRPGTLRGRFNNLQGELGILLVDGARIVFHGLRHTCATLLIKRGEPLIQVSEYLGHDSIEVTQRVYVHLFPEDLRGLADSLDVVAGTIEPPAPPKVQGSIEEFIDDVLGEDDAAAA